MRILIEDIDPDGTVVSSAQVSGPCCALTIQEMAPLLRRALLGLGYGPKSVESILPTKPDAPPKLMPSTSIIRGQE